MIQKRKQYSYSTIKRKRGEINTSYKIPFNNPNILKNSECKCKQLRLIDYWGGQAGFRQYICLSCKKIYTCECERPIIELMEYNSLKNGDSFTYSNPWLYLKNICLDCRGLDDNPPTDPGRFSASNCSIFESKYWYKIYRLIIWSTEKAELSNNEWSEFKNKWKLKWPKNWGHDFISYDINNNEMGQEDFYREKYGFPLIGQGWISETQMFKIITNVFNKYKVIQHAIPDWLKPQHFDVFIPEINLAFEYQGIQHYKPIEFFGGDESFRKRIELDKRKMKLSKLNNTKLIYVRHDDELSEQHIKKIIIRNNIEL